MKKDFTHIVAVLDRSGSMKSIQNDTIGGFNMFLEEQRKVPGEATITLVQFNDKFNVTYADVPLLHAANLTDETYKPSGWTALNDTLAQTIMDVGAKLAVKSEEERPSKVIVLIMTDGEENSSKEFAGKLGLTKVSDMVKHQKEKYSWEFVFIGANIDAFATAYNYGIDQKYSINYISNSIGSTNAFKSVSRGMAASRISGSAGKSLESFFENEVNTSVIADNCLDTTDIKQTIDKYKNTTTITSSNDK